MALKALLLVVMVTAALFAWNSTGLKQTEQTPDTWVDDRGRLHVLGITLGETTLRQAETLLRSRSDIALYIYPQNHPDAGRTLEAFFPAIADHTKVILLLDADDTLLDKLESRATLPHLYPNEVARMNLNPGDLHTARIRVVTKLTLIPSIKLDEATLTTRFGTPSDVATAEDGSITLHFPKVGLVANIDPDGSAQLHFSNP